MATLAHRPIALLGIATICVYGAWYYAFGVLLDPVIDDTGWSETALAGSFSAGMFGIGVGSLFGGSLLDRLGTRVVFAGAAVVAAVSLGLASVATSQWVFVAGAAIGMTTLGALGFYHITMTAVVRIHPGDSSRAIAALTIWGAFASPIYLPLTAWLVDGWGWRTAMRLLLASAVLALVAAAVFVPVVRPDRNSVPPSLRAVGRTAVGTPEARAFTLAVAFVGIAISIILAYQVPVMTAAGLPLGTAATMAGVRGFSQLFGRLPLGLLVDRIGSRSALLVALTSIAVGTVVLTVARSIPVALLFAVLAGFGIGAYSPLQGMYSAELFDHSGLGTTMGLYTSVSMLAGSVGPVAAGLVAEATGDRRWAAVLATAAAIASIFSLGWGQKRSAR